MNLLDLFARITLDTSNYDNGLDGASKKADSFGSKLKSGLTAAGKAAAAGMAAATTAVGAFAAASIKTGASFDSSMSQVAATMGTTVDQIQNLRDFAMDMGAKTAFSATEAADALNYMALAGYSADESMQALPNVLNLAAAGGIDLASASDMVTDAQSALGLSMEESAELVDKMAMASSKSNTSVAQLGEAILTVGGTAKTLAGGTTELSTALGILADNGVKGAEGGTALRNIILSLSAPTDTAAKAMESLKLEAFDANGNLRPLNETFSDLNAALSEMTQGEQTQVLNSIFNKVDLKSVNALLANTGERFDELSGYIDEAQGAAEKMAQTQLDNLAGDVTKFQSALEGVQLLISGELSGGLREFVQFGTEGLSQMSEAFKADGFSGVMDSFTTLLSDGLAMILSKTPQMLEAGGQLLFALAEGISTAVMTVAPTLRDAALNMMSNMGAYLRESLPDLISSGLSLLTDFSASLRENAGLLVDAALELAKNIAKGLADSIPTIIEQVPTIVSNIAGVINDNAPKILAAGVEIIGTLIKGILSSIPTLIANAPKIVSAVVDVITAFNWLNLGKSILDGLIKGIKSLIGNVSTTAKTIVQNFRTVISDLPGYIKAIGADIINGLINGLKASFGKLKDSAVALGETVLGTLKNKLGIHSPSQVFRDEVGQYIALGVAEGIADKTNEAVKAADNLAKDVYSRSKDWADKNTKYMALSLEEQAELWETIQSQFIKGSKQYSDAEEKIFDLRAKAQEEYQKEAEASQKKYLDSATKVLEEFKKKGQEILKENEDLQKQYQDTLAKRASEIFNSFGLFDEIPEREEKSGTKLIENLRGQIDSIQSFYDSLTELEERGAAAALVDEIRGMGVGAADELAALLSLTDDQLSEYSNLYGEKQKLANGIALEELEGLRVETETKIQENLDSLKNLYIELAPDVGVAFADGLAQGILNGLVTVADAAEQVAKAAVEASMKALDEHSPSKLAEKIGLNFDKGLSNGLLSGEDMISRDVNRILDFGTANVDFASSGLGMSSAAIVNSAAGGGLGASGPISLNIPVMLPDGTVLARAMISDLIKVASAAGTPIVSTGYA